MVKTQDSDWGDVDTMLEMVFNNSEKQLILKSARSQVEALITAGTLQGWLDHRVPLMDPRWNPNEDGPRAMLKQY